MRYSFLFLLVLHFTYAVAQPKISFTFDDGSTADRAGYSLEEWNTMILDKLDAAEVKAILFVSGRDKTESRGKYLLKSWDERGHKIANHTLNHPNFNSGDINIEDFQSELCSNDSVINGYDNYVKMFRFPYLKEGNTAEKIDGFRNILKEQQYRNGYVTIDASDWYIDSRLRKRLSENPQADLRGFMNYYLDHLYDRAMYYEQLAHQLTGRHIKHTLLLHHNLLAALFLDKVVERFQEKEWEVISAHDAYTDPVFRKTPLHAGESLIWALAKDSGQFEDTLRYPAEDSRYEKDKMDMLGL